MRIAVVVEHGWDPASVEVDPLSGGVDQTRTVAGIGDPSRSAVALALRLRGPDGRVEVLTAAPAAADDELRGLLAVGVDAVARVWADGLEGAGPEASARALSVHRSTLKYRLQRIRQVSGYDLGLPDVQFNLKVATHAWRTLQALRQS